MKIWIMIAGIAVITALIKAIGPLLLGGRQLAERSMSVISLLPPVLLAALVASSALADGQRLQVDASTAGVAVAGVLIWRRKPLLLSVLVAVAVTATIRAVA